MKQLAICLLLTTALLAGCDQLKLEITSPPRGARIYVGQDVHLSGTAMLKNNPVPDRALSWWLADRQVGQGRNTTLTGLAVGEYRVVFLAQTQDAKGKTIEKRVDRDFRVVDAAPTVTITAPANLARFPVDDAVTLAASANDREDGALQAERIRWRSSLNGDLGIGASIVRRDLKPGTHLITASIGDSAGNTGSAAVKLTIVNEAPRVRIIAPADQTFSYVGQGLTLEGDATDPEDGALPDGSLTWWDNQRSTVLGSGRKLLVIGLSAGDHIITLKAKDRHDAIGKAQILHKVLGPHDDPLAPPSPTPSTTVRFHTVRLGTDGATALRAAADDEIFVGTAASGLLRLEYVPGLGWNLDRSLASNEYLNAPRTTGLAVSIDHVWAAREYGGVRRYARTASGSEAFYGRADGLPSDDLRDIFKDGSGRIWATTALGLARFNAGRWIEPAQQPPALSYSPGAARLAEGGGYLWIATAAGLVRHDVAAGLFSVYDRYNQTTMDYDELTAVAYRAADDSLWLGTRLGGVLRLRGGVFNRYDRNNGLADDEVTALAVDRRGRVWVGTRGGLSRWDGTWATYRSASSDLADDHVRALAVDALDRVLVGVGTAVQLVD